MNNHVLVLEQEWLDHTVDVHLTFEEAGKIFSNEVVPCYISTTNEQEFQFLHILEWPFVVVV